MYFHVGGGIVVSESTVANWQALSTCLHKHVTKETFNTWFKHLRILDWQEGHLKLSAPNRYVKQWIDSHYQQQLLRSAQNLLPETRTFELIALPPKRSKAPSSIGSTLNYELRAAAQHVNSTNQDHPTTRLRSSRSPYLHRLDTFVVGACNRLAFTACQTIVESPATTYNPLMFVGGQGLGKTHLLQGVAHLLHNKYPTQRIRLISCEEFANQYINAIKERTTESFRSEYRKSHVLLVDDIQFLSGKEKTQIEFLHTFDVLRNMGRQIVLTSSVHPREIKRFDDCLCARLQAGLIARLATPCFETRIKLLQTKAKSLGFSMPDDVSEILAQRVDQNTRELEGAVCKLNALSAAEGRAPGKDLALVALRELGYLREGPLSLDEILDAIVMDRDVTIDDIRSARRQRAIVHARHLGMYLSKMLTTKSLGEIGRFFGNRDHATVLHAFRKIKKLMDTDKKLSKEVKALQLRLGR